MKNCVFVKNVISIFLKLNYTLELMPDELKDLKRLEKVLIFTEILFKKIAIMHGKGEFSKIKGSI